MITTIKSAAGWRARIYITLFALGGAAIALPRAAHALAEQTLQYSVTYGRVDAGKIEIAIRAKDDGYSVLATAKPNKLASIFIKTLGSETVYTQQNGKVELARGTEKLKDGERSFVIDRARNVIAFHNDERAITRDQQFESAAFPLSLMQRPIESLGGLRVYEVNARRMREYIYDQPTREEVQTANGRVASWRVTRRRADRPRNTVTVWLARGDNPRPVKIAIVKKDRITTLKLLRAVKHN